MAVIGASYPDMIDAINQMGPDGKVSATLIEILSKLSPVYRFGWHAPCNMGTKHRHNIRTGLPAVTWGRLYQGFVQSKGNYASVEDTTGFVRSMSSVDKEFLKLEPDNAAQIRLNEADGHLEAMMQEFETGFFYHDTVTTPEKFKGLAARYNVLSTSGAGRQIIDAGGTGSDNTSVWFVTWGDRFTSLLYPKGTKAGVDREDKGEQKVLDADGNPYWAMEETFTLHVGASVGDWRYNARIANIDVSLMAAGSVALYTFMRKAYYRLKSRTVPAGQQRIYMNSDVLEGLDVLATNAGASDNFVRLSPMELEGREVMSYRGIPILESEAILNTEARIV